MILQPLLPRFLFPLLRRARIPPLVLRALVRLLVIIRANNPVIRDPRRLDELGGCKPRRRWGGNLLSSGAFMLPFARELFLNPTPAGKIRKDALPPPPVHHRQVGLPAELDVQQPLLRHADAVLVSAPEQGGDDELLGVEHRVEQLLGDRLRSSVLLEAIDGLQVIRLGRLELSQAVKAEANVVDDDPARPVVPRRGQLLVQREDLQERVQRLLKLLRVDALLRLRKQPFRELPQVRLVDVRADLGVVLAHPFEQVCRDLLHADAVGVVDDGIRHGRALLQ
mmetsp:Transcript_27720/g.67226  ORF Transcript_27720/g.67226 Transcript_27720/m.67226 type:complete len:281 (+) Transcript_27720:273-1115(+)